MYNYERYFLMCEAQIPIKVAFSRRRIFKRRFCMDDETGESPNFKKCKFLRLQILLALQASAVLLS